MKRTILFIAFLILTFCSNAQMNSYVYNGDTKITNTFPNPVSPCNCNISVVASANLQNQTSLFPIINYYTGATSTYMLMGYTNNLAISGTVRYDVAFTDENGVQDTILMQLYSVTGYRSMGSQWIIRALAGTPIVVYNWWQIPGTIVYDIGLTLMKIN